MSTSFSNSEADKKTSYQETLQYEKNMSFMNKCHLSSSADIHIVHGY